MYNTEIVIKTEKIESRTCLVINIKFFKTSLNVNVYLRNSNENKKTIRNQKYRLAYKKKFSMSVKLIHYNQIKFCIRVLATQHKKR